MESLLAAFESFFDEWLQRPILLVRAVEEGTDMTLCAKQGASEPDRLVALTRGSSANTGIIIGGLHRVLLSFLADQVVLRVTLTLGSLWSTGFMPVCFAHAPSLPSGTVNCKTVPWGTLAVAHSRPPCASIIRRLIASPSPSPCGLVV